MKIRCVHCKKEVEEAVWVPFEDAMKVPGHLPYCKDCYESKKGILDDKIGNK